MTEPQPIRLTKKRALALLEVFDAGLRTLAEQIASDTETATDATAMREVRRRDHRLADARDAAAIVRSRYAREAGPTPPPSLF